MQKSLKHLYAFFFVLLLQSAQATDSTAIVYANAMQSQSDGNYREAIQLYESILEGQTVSSSLYNNLGLAYINNKQLGLAIVQFERALKVSPSNQDAQHNLKAAQQRIEEQFSTQNQIFFVRWWSNIVHLLTSAGWSIFFLMLIFLGAGGIGLARVTQKTTFKFAGVFILIFSILPLTWGFQQKAIESSNTDAIIIMARIGLHQGPDLASEEIEWVFEGLKVKIIELQDNWAQIKLSNNLIGWVPSQMIEII